MTIDNRAERLAGFILEVLVNFENREDDAKDALVALWNEFRAVGVQKALHIWLGNTVKEMGGFIPNRQLMMEFSDGAEMSDVEKNDPPQAWAARMLLAYMNQNEEMLDFLMEQVPPEEGLRYVFALACLCATNIAHAVETGENAVLGEVNLDMPDV